MKTPICDFVENYIKLGAVRFHMPGHKGAEFLGFEKRDITEVYGADVLYSPDGIIAQSEENATALFGTAHTFYSTEGSSLAIRAMLAIATEKSRGCSSSPLVLAAKNAHKAFIYACALLDLRVEWLYPEETGHVCDCEVTPVALSKKLCELKEKPSAVYVTSPDYLGGMADVAGLSAVCRENGIPLLVDNAHGAYLGFLSSSLHPMALGADLCCDSAHKTLPVLTGGAYLHVSKNAPADYTENARKYLSLFASTSPSYLILQSLDLCNAYIENGYRERLCTSVEMVKKAKERIRARGFFIIDGEPQKLVFDAKKSGYTGTQLAQILREHSIECEFYDPDFLVLMITPENLKEDFERLIETFDVIKPKAAIEERPAFALATEAVISPREAMLSKSESVRVENAVDRICAAPTVACPPAVPIVMSGERITPEHVRAMKYYGYDLIDVVV